MTSLAPSIEPIKLVAQILQAEMDLKDGQIMLGLENWAIPKTQGLYVYLVYGSQTVLGNNNRNSMDDAGQFIEVQEVAMLHQVDIELLSFNSEARTRKEAVLWALASTLSQGLMEKHTMKISQTPEAFMPVPSLEDTKQLNRYRTTFSVNALHSNVKVVNFYDAITPPEVTHNA